jgi:hypothetical protein
MRRADDSTYTLANNASATGAAANIRGGSYTFLASGTIGGATISLQMQTPNGTWSAVTVFAGAVVQSTTLPYSQTSIELPAGNVRAAITGGAGVSLTAFLVGLG